MGSSNTAITNMSAKHGEYGKPPTPHPQCGKHSNQMPQFSQDSLNLVLQKVVRWTQLLYRSSRYSMEGLVKQQTCNRLVIIKMTLLQNKTMHSLIILILCYKSIVILSRPPYLSFRVDFVTSAVLTFKIVQAT